MSKNFQSINDLIKSSQGGSNDDDGSAQSQFNQKQKEIKIKELEREAQRTADYAGLPYFDLFAFPISPDALALIDENTAKDKRIVCFYYDGNNFRLGIDDPENTEVKNLLKELSTKYHCQGKIYLISERSMDYALKLYDNLPKIKKIDNGVEIKNEDIEKFKQDIDNYKNLNEKINEVNTSDVVTLMLATAIKTKASDIHIEAEENGIVVRLRIDGMLQEAAVIKKDKWKKIISRMKLLAKVKINIDNKPQDGRFTIFLTDDKIDIRSSFLPTAFGESVVMRLLRSSSVALSFEDLGLHKTAYTILQKEIQKPNGLILTTGPTGSGKTTTLYAVLNKLNQPGTKIVTLENPVEYKLKGINQSQISGKYTFAQGLRSILRQDPDIVMVGEIRDLETAEISIQASLTGHLVLSTLHTNDSSGVIPRLVDMGIKPYFITPAINAVIGQRLVRKLCPHCRLEHVLTAEEEEKMKKILAIISPKSGVDVPAELPKIYKAGDGCEHCSGIGYKGRIGIYEIFTMSDDIKELTSQGAPAFKILQQAIEDGMITMLQDGILKCLDGVTDLAEIYRVIGKFEYVDTLYDIVMSNTIGRGIKISEADMELGEKIAKDLTGSNEILKESPVSEIIKVIMAAAIKAEAGDIHIEPTETEVKVRFRIDGILHSIVDLSKEHYLQLLSKIKILAGFPTNVKKATWDGRFGLFLANQKMDCRLSIISGAYGETVVIRLLSSQAEALQMDNLGMRPYSLKPLQKSITKTKGIIITTGPTGSGKTTTLYAILNKLNNSDVKIITVEDPIEYHLDGVMQTQINSEEGYTFAAAMRSLLRQNPNVMMIGEIRDAETAKIAIEASQTGHLVLSTLHANSAAGAISRFAGLGIDRQLLASSMECSIGQRLVRKICPFCKQEIKLEEEKLSEVKSILAQIKENQYFQVPQELHFYQGAGCEQCGGIGYKGRLGIYEVINMGAKLQKIIQGQSVTNYEIEQTAVDEGTILMLQDGILKALNGETSIDEVFRVAR